MNYETFWKKMQELSKIYLIFLCAGNICRSPFAAILFEKMIKESPILDISTFKIQSGGFILQKDVIIHPFTAKALLDYHVSDERIKEHIPRHMRKNKEDLRNATALIVMTKDHRDVLLPSKYREKCILLSEAAENKVVELPDPALYNNYKDYKSLMDQIAKYLLIMIKKLEYLRAHAES
ncbi:arsenate-mycothiol transferase ArsC [Candidatus Harpocratesius sp.]